MPWTQPSWPSSRPCRRSGPPSWSRSPSTWGRSWAASLRRPPTRIFSRYPRGGRMPSVQPSWPSPRPCRRDDPPSRSRNLPPWERWWAVSLCQPPARTRPRFPRGGTMPPVQPSWPSPRTRRCGDPPSRFRNLPPWTRSRATPFRRHLTRCRPRSLRGMTTTTPTPLPLSWAGRCTSLRRCPAPCSTAAEPRHANPRRSDLPSDASIPSVASGFSHRRPTPNFLPRLLRLRSRPRPLPRRELRSWWRFRHRFPFRQKFRQRFRHRLPFRQKFRQRFRHRLPFRQKFPLRLHLRLRSWRRFRYRLPFRQKFQRLHLRLRSWRRFRHRPPFRQKFPLRLHLRLRSWQQFRRHPPFRQKFPLRFHLRFRSWQRFRHRFPLPAAVPAAAPPPAPVLAAVPPPAPLPAEVPAAARLPAPVLPTVPPPPLRVVDEKQARPKPVRVAAVPALPASDLERLDEVPAPARTDEPASLRRPLTGMLLFGGLALLCLVGARRRRSAGDPS